MTSLLDRAKNSLARRRTLSKEKKRDRAQPASPPPAYSEAAPPPRASAAAASVRSAASAYTRANMVRDDDPYYFLYHFDTVLLIDDSSSMLGRRWREVQTALQRLAPVCTSHDDDGVDLYFMNHLAASGTPPEGKAATGYYGLTDARQVEELFGAVRPGGPTPTRRRLEDILDPYMAQLEAARASASAVKPLNLIVLTDGMPGPARAAGDNPHLPEPAVVGYARRLDALQASAWQLGIQFIQVGDDPAATRALDDLDRLPRRHRIRDIVDTTKPCSAAAPAALTADFILKAVLGGVDRRLDAD
ncbi:hypothetical protein CDD83_9713 [Cordyceps sp. RAO-2017]|nr:hypothetical protein CDD83_9713 [Cordyceps sp. RAO-2017]